MLPLLLHHLLHGAVLPQKFNVRDKRCSTFAHLLMLQGAIFCNDVQYLHQTLCAQLGRALVQRRYASAQNLCTWIAPRAFPAFWRLHQHCLSAQLSYLLTGKLHGSHSASTWFSSVGAGLEVCLDSSFPNCELRARAFLICMAASSKGRAPRTAALQ